MEVVAVLVLVVVLVVVLVLVLWDVESDTNLYSPLVVFLSKLYLYFFSCWHGYKMVKREQVFVCCDWQAVSEDCV